MATKTLGEALMSAIVQGMIDGETGVAAPVVSRKNAEAEAPASFREEVVMQRDRSSKGTTASGAQMRPALPTVSRHRRVTSPNGLPRPVARLCLVIDNGSGGGRREEGGPCVRRLRRNSWSDRARELGIRVVG